MGISRDLVVPDLRSASPSPLHRSGRLEPQLPGKTPTHKTGEGYRLGTTVSSFSMLVATGWRSESHRVAWPRRGVLLGVVPGGIAPPLPTCEAGVVDARRWDPNELRR